MRPGLPPILAFMFLSVGALAQAAEPQFELVEVSSQVTEKGVLNLAIYNPHGYPVCTPYSNLPGPSDELRVEGTDGRAWEYVGLEADPVGKPEDVRIEATSRFRTAYDLVANYRAPTPESRIAAVYYMPRFRKC